MEIWHNPRCTKSRETLALLVDAGGDPVIRRYLDGRAALGRPPEAVRPLLRGAAG